MLKNIGQFNPITEPTKTIYLPQGRFAFLLLVLEGTTTGGQTLLLTDIGSMRILRDGRELQQATAEFYNRYTDVTGGFPSIPTGGAAAAERVVWEIPFFQQGYENVLQTRRNDEAWIAFNLNALLATRFGANPVTVQVYGYEMPQVMESYELIVTGQNISASGSGNLPETLSVRNLVGIWAKDQTPSVVDRLQLEVDNRVAIDNIDIDVLRDVTNIVNRVETAGQPWINQQIADNGNVAQTLNAVSKMQVQFSGAGILQLNLFAIQWLSAQKRAENKAVVDAYLAGNARN
jgi:hypothetical protein